MTRTKILKAFKGNDTLDTEEQRKMNTDVSSETMQDRNQNDITEKLKA